MIDYAILLVLNSLSIIAIYLLLQPEGLLSSLGIWLDRVLSAHIHPDKEAEIIAKGLWSKKEYRKNYTGTDPQPFNLYAYYPIWKPIKGCVTCMSSFWGLIFFICAHITFDYEISWNLLFITPVYLLSLAGLNRLLSVKADL